MKYETNDPFHAIPDVGPLALKYFALVASCGSVRAAADILYVTPSSISRQIAKIERALKTTLFHRKPNGMQPTPAGQILMACIQRMGLDLQSSISEIHSLANLKKGEISICSVEGMVENFLSEQVCKFHARHPLISVNITVMSATDVIESIGHGNFDLGISFNTPARENVMLMRSVTQPIRAYCNPAHVSEYEGVRDLQQLPLDRIILQDHSFWIRRAVTNAFQAQKIRLAPSITSNSLLMLNSMVRDGNYVTFLPTLAAYAFARRGDIAELALRDPILESTHIDICICSSRRQSAATNAFMKQLQSSL